MGNGVGKGWWRGRWKAVRARPRKWAQQVVVGRAGMRRDDESVTHGVAPRMLILPPRTLPPLYLDESHSIARPQRHRHFLPFTSTLDPFWFSPSPFETNPRIIHSIIYRPSGGSMRIERDQERCWRTAEANFRGTTASCFREGMKETRHARLIHERIVYVHVTSRFRVKISFIAISFPFPFFFFTAKRSSGFSDPMIHDNSNSSRPGLIHRIDLFRESRRTHPTDSSFLLLVPCIILLTFYLPLERSRSGRILDKVFQRKGGIVIA